MTTRQYLSSPCSMTDAGVRAKRLSLALALVGIIVCPSPPLAARIPSPFVYLRNIDPSILQDIRYATRDNFANAAMPGYGAKECILHRAAALALRDAQKEFKSLEYGILVYDCYRPIRASRFMMRWASAPQTNTESQRYHPRVAQGELIARGYIAAQSLHATGHAVDLTIIRLDPAGGVRTLPPPARFPCGGAEKSDTLDDGVVDMGTGFDCFDPKSHADASELTLAQRESRRLLTKIMSKHGFAGYRREWWHFHYKQERPGRRSDFPIVDK